VRTGEGKKTEDYIGGPTFPYVSNHTNHHIALEDPLERTVPANFFPA
jgi:hypothetical protein